MDNMCSDSQPGYNKEDNQCNDIQKDENSACKSVFKFTSPVLRTVSQPNRRRRYDSTSDDDIVSCKTNLTQTRSKKTKSFSEEKSEYDNIFPLNLGSSPLTFSSVERGRSGEIQTIGSLLKGDYFESYLKNNWHTHVVSSEKKSKNPFESLGMDEKDISWASSMASPPPSILPTEELNTKEKETLLPEEGFRCAQPRALFSPNSTDDDCGCKPLKNSSDSELSENNYGSEIRLSDVCQTLKDMNVKSLESAKGSFLNETDATLVNDLMRSQSPVITKKKRKIIKKKEVLVISPMAVKKCEDNLISESSKSDEQSNQIADDSFQNISFSYIDEICKNSLVNDSGQDNQTLVPGSVGKKIFYESKTGNEILGKVSALECILKTARLIEEADVGTSSKNLKSLGNVKKGLVPFKTLLSNESTVSTKRLRSEIVSNEKSCEKKKLKIDDSKNESEWDSFKNDLLSSDNDITDSQIFRTFEDLEKAMENEEKKNLSPIGEEPVSESLENKSLSSNREEPVEVEPVKFVGFSAVSGKSLIASDDSLKKVESMFAENEKKFNELKNNGSVEIMNVGFSTVSGKSIPTSANSLKKVETMFIENEKKFNQLTKNENSEKMNVGFSTVSGKNLIASDDSLKKVESMFAVNEKKFNESKNNGSASIGFTTASGSRVKISKNPLKKTKNIFEDEDFNDLTGFKNNDFGGFKTAKGGGTFEVSSKVKLSYNNNYGDNCDQVNENNVLMMKPDTDFTADFDDIKISDKIMPESKSSEASNSLVSNTNAPGGFKTCLGSTANFSEKALSKAETLLEPQELSESEEKIPPWVHVYQTSPSYLLGKKENSAFVSEENGDGKKLEPFMVKSPVLGKHDRFITKGKKIARRLNLEPLEKPSTAPCQKRYSTNLTLDDLLPLKKHKSEECKIGDSVTSESIIEARKLARLDQRQLGEKKNVKPVKGKHLTKKCNEQQTPLTKFVENEFPGNYTKDELNELGIKDYVVDISIENAAEFKFKAVNYFGTSCCENINGISIADDCYLILDDNNEAGLQEFTDAFFACPGVESSLISKEWVSNHYKWIVWKLAHYETSFPKQFGGQCLTPENVLLQLKYRYDREVDRNERSALKKILERDDSSAKRIVLCVCRIKKVLFANNQEGSENLTTYHLGVTDGWYSCNAQTDSAMVPFIEKGKITVGTKFVTYGAELINGGQGISPLEVTDDVYLKISTNSTRRIRWDAKLGFQKNPGPIPISLDSILPQGGVISRVDVIIVRTYPIVYVEKQADGSRVTRNRRLEDKAAAAFEREQEARIEKIYSDVQTEFQKKNFKKSMKCDEEDLCELLETCSDPSSLYLSVEQTNSLMKYNDLRSKEISEILQGKLKAEKLNKRDVSELLKVKIVDLRKPDYCKFGVLSLWRPSEDIVEFFVEGKAISVLNVAASRSFRNIQLNTTRQTKYLEISRQVKYPCRSLTRICDISTELDSCFDEIDIVGMVVFVHEMSHGSVTSQTVYFTDNGVDFLGVVFWGSSADFGWENVLKVRSVVASSNLQLKKNSKSKNISCAYVNENTVFTENPRQQHLSQGIENVKKILNQDINDLITKCQEEITSRLDNSHHHVSKNLSNCSDSSVNDGSFNKPRYLNGFAMKPNASSTPLKSKKMGGDLIDNEPSPIQTKIEKLMSYGEPPPISPLIPESNIKKFRKKFKVPLKQSSTDTTPAE